ncbi:uncharacterized protein LOC109863183 [Pseudomyrmex gracilis]|uniref:uncharacterized protein LOC109863183 n=1 Tax=Pseudomyrmex gracilis TaxID=219809 RepID=UPI000995778C|nr:uncharacterized protein LOC109863183 [Pseudomyrmex gracilis]
MAAAWWIIQLAEEEKKRYLKLERRHLRDTTNPFDILESQFQYLYRLSKDATLALCEYVRSYVQPAVRSTAIPLELKVLGTLDFLSSGSYQRRVGQDFLNCVCQSSISNVIHQIVDAINIIMPDWIKFPTQPNEIQTIQQQYNRSY